MTAVIAEAVQTPFALVAYSCASMLAVRYAVEHPERVSHMILVAAQ
jgi:pimeloyl-ACP methyl ester carboxylesterase